MDDRCLLCFVRNPKRGAVKTRIAVDIGEQRARDLYRNFILDMLSTFRNVGVPLTICYHPQDAINEIMQMVGQGYRFESQLGDNLGLRMEHCFGRTFSGSVDRAAGIGSDIPDLPGEIIEESFNVLEVFDAVIGPSLDGGYYLIGFKRKSYLPEVFSGIPWGTNRVLRKTLDILRKYKLTTHLLPTWNDIDTKEDLRQFYERNRNTSNCPRTMAYLNQSGLLSTEGKS